jgi:hypothetical protein
MRGLAQAGSPSGRRAGWISPGAALSTASRGTLAEEVDRILIDDGENSPQERGKADMNLTEL